MKNRYYAQNSKEQFKIQITLGLAVIILLALIILISILIHSLYLGLFLTAILISIIAPFFDIPSLVKNGKLKYFSNFLLAEKPKNGIVKIHGGSSFDYYFVFDGKMNAEQRTIYILQQHIEGLLLLIEEYRHDKNIKIQGTSYFFNQRTANKFGFKAVEGHFIQKLILFYNYFSILLAKSIAKKRVSFPNLSHINTYETNVDNLIKRELYMKTLNSKLKRALTNKVQSQ